MKNFVVAALVALTAQAITISEAVQADTMSAEFASRDMTIVGFLFQGLDFGLLWEDLTEDQKDEVKKSIFNQTLKFGGFDATNFADGTFKFTDEERTAAEAKQIAAEEEEEKKDQEKKPAATEEKKADKTLAQQWGGRRGWNRGWGGASWGWGGRPWGWGVPCGFAWRAPVFIGGPAFRTWW